MLLVCTVAAPATVFGSAVDCETGRYAVSHDFPGGGLASCVATEDSLHITLAPEDKPPINPSPWYAFKITRIEPDSPVNLDVRLTYPPGFQHRYLPKLSRDGTNWTPMPQSDVSVSDDGTAHFKIVVDSKILYVSAQENLNLDWYRDWIEEIKDEWLVRKVETIGHSIARHPIEAIETSPESPNVILLLGRAHPPEIPGALAMREFVRSLASIRVESCLQGLTPECRFFSRHNFLIVPLLNPDGVALGHWRHNLGSADLNRDWGEFAQPETASVQRKLDSIAPHTELNLMLDFHSTNRDVLYVQDPADQTEPTNFTEHWIKNIEVQNHAAQIEQTVAGYEIAPRPNSDNGTSKNYFYSKYGVPAITFETGDNTNRDDIPSRMAAFATALVDTFIQIESVDSADAMQSSCSYTYSRTQPCSDFYCFLIEANKASLVSSVADGLIEADVAEHFALAMLTDSVDADQNDSLRVSDYLKLEGRLSNRAGVEISNIHIGRSRQDLHGTVRRMLARDRWMELHMKVNRNRKELLGLAESHLETIVPAYTHGVPSQPTTFGHQLLAYADSLGRTSSRLREGYKRLNKSPYGAGPGTTSGIYLNRDRLATLLGFESPVINSFDANFVDSMNYKNELAGVLSDAALTINQFVANIHSQQRDPHPWIYLGDSSVSSSSSMPQKRNPRDLDRLRTVSNQVLSLAHQLAMNSHNVDAGMHDYRMASNISNLADAADSMFDRFLALLQDLVVDPQRAQSAIKRSFATSAQVAELLVENSDLSFREAQEFAAALVERARSTDRHLNSLDDAEFEEVYVSIFNTDMPVEATAIQNALNSYNMVFERKGLGGPQLDETARMLNEGYKSLADDLWWYKTRQSAIISADIALQDDFFEICSNSP
ncbi:MAG: lyase family protein [Gammaproteobacteria bacterium]|nr:lyase family protein [Gammaproteobacteria bacterium]